MSAVCMAALTLAVSGQLIFNRDHTSKWFRCVFVQWQKKGGVESFQPRAAATAVSTTGLLPIVSTTGVSLSCFSRWRHGLQAVAYHDTHTQVKHNCIHRYVLIVHWLLGCRLNCGQTHFRCLIINRHVFILHMHTPQIHHRHAPDCLHNQRFFFSSCSCLSYRAVGTGSRPLPTRRSD